jgi:hypothetical protein
MARRREACDPGAVVLEAAAPSAHCSTRSPSSTAPSTPSWSSAPFKPWRCHAGAASRHGSTTSPPLARRQPTLIRVALTCIHTAHTTHSRHRRLPIVARFHSTARAPADTFLVPAQPSQDKTFSSPTAVGETPGSSYQLHEDNNALAAVGQGTMQDEPLAVRSITALHECEPGASSLQAPPSMAPSLPRGRVWHRAMIAPPSPRSAWHVHATQPCSAFRM